MKISPLEWKENVKSLISELSLNGRTILSYSIHWVNKAKGVQAYLPNDNHHDGSFGINCDSIKLAQAHCQNHWEGVLKDSGWLEDVGN